MVVAFSRWKWIGVAWIDKRVKMLMRQKSRANRMWEKGT